MLTNRPWTSQEVEALIIEPPQKCDCGKMDCPSCMFPYVEDRRATKRSWKARLIDTWAWLIVERTLETLKIRRNSTEQGE